MQIWTVSRIAYRSASWRKPIAEEQLTRHDFSTVGEEVVKSIQRKFNLQISRVALHAIYSQNPNIQLGAMYRHDPEQLRWGESLSKWPKQHTFGVQLRYSADARSRHNRLHSVLWLGQSDRWHSVEQ